MTIKVSNIYKSFVIILLLLYFLIFNQANTMIFDATLTLVLSFLLLLKNKGNNLLLILSVFIFYCVYSIVMGEYYFSDTLGVPMSEVSTPFIYGTTIRVLLLFLSILYFFMPKIPESNISIKYRDNSFIYYVLCFVLVMIGYFGIDRNLSSSYTVSVSSFYEYSTILFVFAYYTSGNKRFKKFFLSVLLLVFVLQDFYYGGRVTSLQLLIILVYFMTKEWLKPKHIYIGAGFGVVLNTFVGIYRTNFNLDHLSLTSVFESLKNNLFVFDTATYSYYASATHVASVYYGLADVRTRLNSFANFLKMTITGSDDLIGNVTRFVNENYFGNVGGGVIATHFYFWLGWVGVIIAGIIIVIYLNKITKLDSNYAQLSFLLFVSSSPRWFLYNPLLLIRVQVLFTVLYLTYQLGNKFLLSIAGKNKYISHKS